MANIFNEDFRDFLIALRRNQVLYVLVRGYSVILHGYARTTGAMDIWVKKTEDNYQRLVRAFREFGMPVFDMTADNFLYNPDFDVFSFGRPPVSIDIITQLKGLDFDEAYAQATDTEIEGITLRLIHFNDLIQAKRAAGRAKDINDIENLTGGSVS